MAYVGNIFRPPSEARSFILQVTVGCSNNQCTFCNMYKDKKFRVKDVAEVFDDIQAARRFYRYCEKIFLADGDVLCLKNDKLMRIIDEIHRVFPECKRISVYGSAKDALRKTEAELKELHDAGVGIVYIGAESGSDAVLKDVKKGATAQELIEGVRKVEESGLQASVTFISGLGGPERWEEHAVETGKMITAMEPSYVGLLTLMLERGAPMAKDLLSGKFRYLTPEEVLAEAALMIKNINVKKKCVFRSNHASNYLPLRGDLPDDKEMLLQLIHRAMENTGMLRDERFRAL